MITAVLETISNLLIVLLLWSNIEFCGKIIVI
jgi:hypothetical protein